MTHFLFSFSIITGSLATGYLVQQLVARQWLWLPVTLDTARKALQKIALLFVLPVTIASAIWIANVRTTAIAALPLFGFGAIMLGGISALVLARAMGLSAYKSGAFYACGSFTNIGSMGALICYVYLGEAGFALVPIYKIFEEITYYSIGFPIAKYFSGTEHADNENALDRIKRLTKDPFILVAVSSILIGAALNFAGLPRPACFSIINAFFIPLGTGLLLVSIGLAMKFKSVRFYLKECLAVSAIKFLIVPLVISGAAYLIGYGAIDNGLPLRVIIILTSMPVAFIALIPPSIYDLDLDLANSCWFFSTACLVWVLPLLLVIIRTI